MKDTLPQWMLDAAKDIAAMPIGYAETLVALFNPGDEEKAKCEEIKIEAIAERIQKHAAAAEIDRLQRATEGGR